MKKVVLGLLLTVFIGRLAVAQVPATTANQPVHANLLQGLRSSIEKYLGRRYVWGATGLKSFDCSGFIWRVMYENGILLKRTTARKFYMMLPPAPPEEHSNFGTLIFFDDLTHVGIVDSQEAFYHAQVRLGTQRSVMTPFWRRKIYGFRRLPSIP
jgi:cell wall-associated NlpC family hydrolase